MTTLLYVDDEEALGRAVAKWFERQGHTVHVAHTGAQARVILLAHEVDAVFIDVWLATESGFELMSWIQDARPDVANRVTFVTGQLADATRSDRNWRTLGRPVVQKPFDFAQLEAHLPAVTRSRNIGNAPSATSPEHRAGT